MLQINASIATHQGKIWCAYQTKHLRHYNAECCLTELNAELEPVAEKRLFAQNGNTAFEGIKLLSVADKLLAFYNYLPFDENTGWKQQYSVGYGEVNTLTGVINNQTSLREHSKKQDEKNWSPYIWKGDLYVLADLSPLRIIKITGANQGEVFLAQDEKPEWQYGEFSGGTPLISSPDDSWLYGFAYSFMVDDGGFRKRYYYTVIRFDPENNRLEYHPTPLNYDADEVDTEYEFLWLHSNGKHHKGVVPSGITPHEDGAIVSFGKDDVLSYTEHFSWERIKGYFN